MEPRTDAAAPSADTEKRMSYEEVHAYVREHFCPDMDDHPEAMEWADQVWRDLKRDYPGGMRCGSASSTKPR